MSGLQRRNRSCRSIVVGHDPEGGEVDTIRRLALERHFWTAQLTLGDFGQVLLIGDQPAVERIWSILEEHDEHDLVLLPDRHGSPDAAAAA
jgi:hypothetical protein